MSFGRIFFFIFGFALLEVLVLAKVAGLIGWPITIVATVATAMLGSYLFRSQGLDTWVRLNQKMQQGDMPGQEMVEGIMLLLGGALLITPGFITDAVGFALLLPTSRRLMARKVIEKGTLQSFSTIRTGNVVYTQYSRQNRTPGSTSYDQGHVIIEGEAQRTDDDRKP